MTSYSPQKTATHRTPGATYGLLGAPLAMAALPLFTLLPAYYASHIGVALTHLGWILFAARLLDMLQDPILGHLLDHPQRNQHRWMLLAALLLALTFAALWLPPDNPAIVPLWLGTMLVLAYGAHSVLSIAYLSWGARIQYKQVKAIAWREGAGLVGVIASSIIPAVILASNPEAITSRLTLYSIVFAILLLVAVCVLLRFAVRPLTQATTQHWHISVQDFLRNKAMRALLLPYLLNGLAVAIPATLALFFIKDQLQAPELSGAFLACYFGTAACGLPIWTQLAHRIGPLRSWRLGMMLSIAAFVWATLLGAGDITAYFVICIVAGLALGADLVLPPVLVASAINPGQSPGAVFGIFTLLGKLSLALAGLSLPLLDVLGYRTGSTTGIALPLTYAAIPCLLKLLAMITLTRCKQFPKMCGVMNDWNQK
jgi:GPH family glycoside/pentoside/hexuronide:cation symporter